MNFVITCPHCGKQYELESEAALGRRARCSACKNSFVISTSDPSGLSERRTRPRPVPPLPPPPIQVRQTESTLQVSPLQREVVIEQPMKFCHACGETIHRLAEICPHCGVHQHDVFATREHTVVDSPSKVAACLFALFLGLFGAHKFYVGQTMMGVLYLVLNVALFWTIIVPAIFSVICLVEGLVYLTYSDRDFARRYRRR